MYRNEGTGLSEDALTAALKRARVLNLLLGGATVGGAAVVLVLVAVIDPGRHSLEAWVASIAFALLCSEVAVVEWLYAREIRHIARACSELRAALRRAHASDQDHERELGLAQGALHRTTAYLDLCQQLGRISTEELRLKEFASRAVAQIRECLGHGYVAVYLVDEEREYAVLQAWAGGDEKAVRGGQLLAIGQDSLLDQCVSSGKTQIVSSVDGSRDPAADFPFLAREMGSAIALPMIARGQMAGVLTLQSESTNAFSSGDVPPLVGVADQVAQAVAHAVLSEKLEAQLREMEALQSRYVREAWDSFAPRQQTTLYEYEQFAAPPLADAHTAATEPSPTDVDLAAAGQLQAADQSALLSPIRLRERILGVLGLPMGESERGWTEDQIELAAAISEQMGLILENARLFEEARYRADRERKAREITARMRETLDVESVLKTAADELYRAFDLDDVVIHLTTGEVEGAAQKGV